MTYMGMTEDGLYAFAKGEEIFIEHYEKKWDETLADIYYHTNLLEYGHKFRPRLVYWGYCAGSTQTDFNENDYDAISQVAVCIELVHKASILLDDYIDGDTARHGMDAFHITHGPERTMIFSLHILCRSLRIINEIFADYINDSTYSKVSLKLVIQTLEDMTLGVLRELDLPDNVSMQKLDEIKEIMHLETASLITNSLLIGYLLSRNIKTNDIELFEKIGRKMELKLEDVSAEEKDSLLLRYFTKHDIKEKLFIEINDVCKRVHNNISKMASETQNYEWCGNFHTFVDSVISVSKKRLE